MGFGWIVNRKYNIVADYPNYFHIFVSYLDMLSSNGPVIPPDLHDKIFVPFFTTKKEGSGIGLSISQEIVRLHKGTLTAASAINGETVFVMEI